MFGAWSRNGRWLPLIWNDGQRAVAAKANGMTVAELVANVQRTVTSFGVPGLLGQLLGKTLRTGVDLWASYGQIDRCICAELRCDVTTCDTAALAD